MIKIINELKANNGSKYKLGVLRKHKDNELLQRVLKMTYDTVAFTYGISTKTITKPEINFGNMTLEMSLILLEQLNAREITGNEARDKTQAVLEALTKEDADILYGIINRDLRINMGRSNINKVFKGLIVKPPYMRCKTYSEKTASKIKFPAYVQVKADGMFQYAQVENSKVTFIARSGEEREFPHLVDYFKKMKDGVYVGELLVHGITDRALANGFINSDEPKDTVYFQLWDYIKPNEFNRPKDKTNKTKYKDRFKELEDNLQGLDTSLIKIIETAIVKDLQEAMFYTQYWMQNGLEGSILKDFENIFIDHNSPTQLKLKLEIECDVRITGFTEGTGKNAPYFGAITFENDEKTVQGKVGVSSMPETLRDWFHANRVDVIGKVIEVQFNDLTKSRENEYYALSHPRFIEIRDKDETDTLEKINENKLMAMQLKKRIKD